MQKNAQKRGLLDWISEKTDLGGIATERVPFLNHPGFKDVMDNLREVDDNARSIALGKAVGNGTAPTDGMSLKDMLKGAEESLGKNEYMRAAAYLGRFHKKMEDIVNVFSSFKSNLSDIHEKFLLEGLDPETREHISSLRGRLAYKQYNFVKEAGIKDFFVNLFSDDRGRALAAWERIYNKNGFTLKADIKNILSISNSMFNALSRSFKDLSKARNKRLVGEYEAILSTILKSFPKYDASFRNFYAKNIKAYADKLVDKPLEVTPPSSKEESGKPSSKEKVQSLNLPISAPLSSEQSTSKEFSPPAMSAPSVSVPAKTLKEQTSIIPPPSSSPSVSLPHDTDKTFSLPEGKIQISPRSQTLFPPAPEAISSQPGALEIPIPTDEKTQVSGFGQAQAALISTLESLSNESPLIVKRYLAKYAAMIQKKDAKLAQSLIEIVNRIEV
jgi:hypothetical protein